MVEPVTLTEAYFRAPDWLAALLSNSCVFIKGRVGMGNLAALRDLCPPGVLAWTLLEVPYITYPEAYAFLAGQLPLVPQVVPRPVYIIPNCPVKALDAALHLKAERPWVQWVAEVPDLDLVYKEEALTLSFFADSGTFEQRRGGLENGNYFNIPLAAREWARDVLPDWTDPAKVRERVAAEASLIQTAALAFTGGGFRALYPLLRSSNRTSRYQVEAIYNFACQLGGFPDRHIARIVDRHIDSINS